MPTFTLHPQLAQDSIAVGHFDLCQLRLINDCQYPWFILVPEHADISEIFQLAPAEQQQLQHESCLLAAELSSLYQADKMNIAAIGNLVPQLHLHHIVRYRQDPTWPAPIWGKLPLQAYGSAQLSAELSRVQQRLKPWLRPASANVTQSV